MSFAQTNGIPQGSILMDFIAEIILSYIDFLLTKKLQENKITEYKIIRYRDDYKIFTKNSENGKIILEILSQILMENGLALNKDKTFISNDIISFSEKKDKQYFEENINFNKNIYNNIKKLYNFSKIFPNSGQLKKYLHYIYKDICKQSYIANYEEMISIITNLMYENRTTIPICCGILSILLQHVKDINYYKKYIFEKFKTFTYNDYSCIWLQRLFLEYNDIDIDNVKICKLVKNKQVDSNNILWEISCFNEKIQQVFKNYSIINNQILNNKKQIITKDEINEFYDYKNSI